MKIIQQTDMQDLQFTCPVCRTKFIADQQDVKEGMITTKVEENHYSNGYNYGRVETKQYRSYVRCPFCQKEIAVNEAEFIGQNCNTI